MLWPLESEHHPPGWMFSVYPWRETKVGPMIRPAPKLCENRYPVCFAYQCRRRAPQQQTLRWRLAQEISWGVFGAQPYGGGGVGRSEQVEKSSCNAVSTKELFQVEPWGSSLCGHLPIELSPMQADSRSRVKLGLGSSLQLRTFPKRDAAESRQHLQLLETPEPHCWNR